MSSDLHRVGKWGEFLSCEGQTLRSFNEHGALMILHQAYETQLAQIVKSSPCVNLRDAAFMYLQQTWESI